MVWAVGQEVEWFYTVVIRRILGNNVLRRILGDKLHCSASWRQYHLYHIVMFISSWLFTFIDQWASHRIVILLMWREILQIYRTSCASVEYANTMSNLMSMARNGYLPFLYKASNHVPRRRILLHMVYTLQKPGCFCTIPQPLNSLSHCFLIISFGITGRPVTINTHTVCRQSALSSNLGLAPDTWSQFLVVVFSTG